MEPSAPPRAPGGRRNGRQARSAQEFRAYARDRLIESRLTQNAISMVGLAGNLIAAALVTQRLFFLAGVAMCVVAVLGSLMVSYTRARAEALGVECKVGLATRPVRVVILSIGLVFAKGAGLGDFELMAPAV